MRKWLAIVGIVIVILLASVYFFIPLNHIINIDKVVNCTETGALRQIHNSGKWISWWPGEKAGNGSYSYKGFHYKIKKVLLNGFEVTVSQNQDSTNGFFQIMSNDKATSIFQWNSAAVLSTNPVKRLIQHQSYRRIQKNIESFMTQMQEHFSREENIYGMKIHHQKVKDSSLISTRQIFGYYPSTKEIYDMIVELKNYIRIKGGEENNHPMLNVHQTGSTTFEAMVAIPTKWDLPSAGKFQIKKMVLGNILMGEVKGGIHTVKAAEQEMHNYVYDFKKTSPAIPFQSLVTDRAKVGDTALWITRMYYPVFY